MRHDIEKEGINCQQSKFRIEYACPRYDGFVWFPIDCYMYDSLKEAKEAYSTTVAQFTNTYAKEYRIQEMGYRKSGKGYIKYHKI